MIRAILNFHGDGLSFKCDPGGTDPTLALWLVAEFLEDLGQGPSSAKVTGVNSTASLTPR